MTTLRHEIEIETPREKVWQVLADLEAVKHYNPTVSAVKIVSDSPTGVGATRDCDLKPSGRVVERVFEWDEMNSLGIEVAESTWPISEMRWTTSLADSGSGTKVSQVLDYSPKFGPLGALLNMLMMRRKLNSTIAEVFVELKRYSEGKAAG